MKYTHKHLEPLLSLLNKAAANPEPAFEVITMRSGPTPVLNGQGGATLKLFSEASPAGEALGYVLASPNIPRAYHSGFDSDDKNRLDYGGDWFDKIVYVTLDDYKANGPTIDVFSAVLSLMRQGLDQIDAAGCSYAAGATQLLRLNFSTGSPQFDVPHGPYAVLAASFQAGSDIRTMPVTEYWIAAPGDEARIFKTQAHKDAAMRSNSAAPADAGTRRNVVRAHVKNLRGAFKADPFDVNP